MWISRKKFRSLEKRIADLEMVVRSQQKEITSYRKGRPKSDVIRGVIQEANTFPEKPLRVNIAHPTILEQMFEQKVTDIIMSQRMLL